MSEKIDDMNILDFGRLISMNSIETPLSKAFDEEYGQKADRWWSCQREHLTVWCLHQPTTGVGSFKHKPNCSAKAMYNYFGRPETLLWLVESLGEDAGIISFIINEIKDIKNPRSACKLLRQRISFTRILELIDSIA